MIYVGFMSGSVQRFPSTLILQPFILLEMEVFTCKCCNFRRCGRPNPTEQRMSNEARKRGSV